MNNQCFYCEDAITENSIHLINFFHNQSEREEKLCPDCYAEWLQGIKG